MVGETSSYGAGLWDSLICKLKSRTGELVWFQTFGEELFDTAYDVFLDKDENVIVVGDTESSSNGWDIFICQYSPKTGELLSNYTWGEDKNDRCKSGVYFFDGIKEALYLVGATGSFGILYSDLLLLLFLDTDGDKLTDKWESDNLTDPLNADSDQDGLDDYQELAIHNTDPLNPDTDADGWLDGKEVVWGTDPLNPKSTPARRKAILFPSVSVGLLLVTGSIFFVIFKKKRNKAEISIK